MSAPREGLRELPSALAGLGLVLRERPGDPVGLAACRTEILFAGALQAPTGSGHVQSFRSL